MIQASEIFDYAALPALGNEGLLTARRHPSAPLTVYSYTARCQYDKRWTPETLACRGLILDDAGYVYARPFPKFFNVGEIDGSRWPLAWDAFEKLDGSLGIAFRNPVTGEIEIATRGAFESPQARWATAWWRSNANSVEIGSGETWCFEIVYPDNRIVVDYGSRAELILLAVIDHATGLDLPLPSWGGSVARQYSGDSVNDLVAQVDSSNFEGFVIRCRETGARWKVKLDEYKRLHRLLTELSPLHLWELVAAGEALDPVLDRVPDEFYHWVAEQEGEFRRTFAEWMADAWKVLADPRLNYRDRKAAALLFNEQPAHLRPLLFKMLDRKDPSDLLWKALRPTSGKGFALTQEVAP
jgi:hypothetical protein